MSGTKEIDKLYLERLDRNELLLQAAERAVLRGEMRPEAVADLHELYKDKCLVHDNEVTLNGRSLDDAVGELIRKRPLWRPPVDDPLHKLPDSLHYGHPRLGARSVAPAP